MDGLPNIFQDDQPLRGINWWLMISIPKLGEVTFSSYVQQLEFHYLGCETSGGHIVIWVGVELRHRSYQLGISERRAQWIINWTKKNEASTSVNVSTFEEGIGRVMYVAGAPARIRAPLPRTTL